MQFKILGLDIAIGQKSARSFSEIIAAIDGGIGGSYVGRDRALQVSAFFACCNVLAEAMATPPIRIFELKGYQATPMFEHPVARLFNSEPNQWQTGFEFREQLAWHALLDHGGYAYINRVGKDYIELLPLEMGTCRPVLDERWRHGYEISFPDGHEYVSSNNVLAITRVPFRNGEGTPILNMARQALGLSISAEDAQRGLYDNGGRLAGVLSTDQKLTAEHLQFIQEAFKKAYAGGQNAFKTAVLDAGFKFTPVTATADDSQTIETRRFAVEEVCRFMNVYPQVVMQSANTSTHASAESFFSAQVRQSFMPWWRRMTAAIDRDLLDGAGKLEARYDANEYTRASTKDRAEYYRTMAEMGILTRNEIRALEGRPPLPGLDEPLTPMNMQQGNDDDAED